MEERQAVDGLDVTTDDLPTADWLNEEAARLEAQARRLRLRATALREMPNEGETGR